jgi:aminopeptidase N
MRFFQFVFFLIFVSNLFGQRQEKVDFIWANARIRIFHEVKLISGEIAYEFEVLENVDSIFFDAKNIDFQRVNINEKKVDFLYDGRKISIHNKFEKGKSYIVHLKYFCSPKQTVYFQGFDDNVKKNEQIWTQGQGKYTSHWLPSFDDMEEKVKFTFNFLIDKRLSVIANGRLASTSKEFYETPGFQADDSKYEYYPLRSWRFYMQNPMSSYLAAFAIGNFDKKELKSSSGVPIELYYEPKDSLKVEPTYRHTKEIFDFLEKEIDVPYPWQNYKQVPVQDFLYAGMENTSATIFSNTYMIDSTAFVDKNYVNVNAHELAHQWFGNLVTEESSKHHWLHEGFATYYAYLTEKELFGDDHFYWKLYETAKTLNNLSESGGGEALTNPNANSLTFYEKGAWALVILRDKVGDEAFRKGVKNYLEKHQFKNVTISDFLVEIEAASNQGLDDFRAKWLASEVFPWEDVKRILKNSSESVSLVFEMENEFQRIQSDDLDYELYWNKTDSPYFHQYIIEQYHRILPKSVLNKAFSSNNIKVRQALSSSLYGISGARLLTEELVSKFETLLDDKSYTTIENALIKLWSTFPEKRAMYFSKTENVIGLPDKNIRLLWLTLALITPEYQPDNKEEFLRELNEYTASYNHFEVRQLAFQYLSQIQAMNDESLVNLIKASEHHVWQFKKSSRNLLRELSESNEMKERLLRLTNSLSDSQKEALKQLIRK